MVARLVLAQLVQVRALAGQPFSTHDLIVSNELTCLANTSFRDGIRFNCRHSIAAEE